MSFFSALLQGAIQGLTEFFPVSSSGHLSVFQYFTGQEGESGTFFIVMLHLGTLIAVCIAFHATIFEVIREFFTMMGEIFTGRFKARDVKPKRRMLLLLLLSLAPLLITALFKDFFEMVLHSNSIVVEGVCFIITGMLIMYGDRFGNGRKKAGQMTVKDALAMGAVQGVAPLPGLSRSGSTVSVGLAMGLDRQFAVAFSFIMGIPAVLGANILEFADLIRGDGIHIEPLPLIAGLISSIAFGLLSIKLVRVLISNKKYKYFAYYVLTIGVIVLAVGVIELANGQFLQRMVAGW